MYQTKFWASGGLAEIFCLTLLVLYRVGYIAGLKFGGPPASRAHSSVDIPGVIGKRSIKIVFYHGQNLLPKRGTGLPLWISTAPLPTAIWSLICSCVLRSGAAISIEDIGALISLRLKHSIWYDSFALYCVNDGVLIPAFVIGKSSEGLASLRIPLGEGLSGWVAENRKLILNGNPSVEPGYPNDPAPDASLRSPLVMPLGVQPGGGSVLALYRAAENAFTADDLRVFEAIRAGLESAIYEAQRPKAYQASSRS